MILLFMEVQEVSILIQFLHFPLMGTMPKLNWNRSQVLFIFDQTRLSTYYLQNEICNTTTIDKSFVICEPKQNNEFDVFCGSII